MHRGPSHQFYPKLTNTMICQAKVSNKGPAQIVQREIKHHKPTNFIANIPIQNFSTKPNQQSSVNTTQPFWEPFKKKKAEYVVKYGASFLLVHELLGISSYLIVYQLLNSHMIEITTFANWFGWSEDDLKAKGIDPTSKLITFAMTVVIVKGLDVMGLVPIRWALSFLISPLVARFLGPIIDPWFASARKVFGRKKE